MTRGLRCSSHQIPNSTTRERVVCKNWQRQKEYTSPSDENIVIERVTFKICKYKQHVFGRSLIKDSIKSDMIREVLKVQIHRNTIIHMQELNEYFLAQYRYVVATDNIFIL